MDTTEIILLCVAGLSFLAIAFLYIFWPFPEDWDGKW